MQCPECGESARDMSLRYCENCGAKMPAAPVRGTGTRPALTSTGTQRGTGSRPALPAPGSSRGTGSSRAVTRDASEPARSAPRPMELDDHTDPGVSSPRYDGPVLLTHVPGHSPSVLGLGLLMLAVVFGIALSGVGPLWSLAVIVGGYLVMAREMIQAGQKNAWVDWVPESLLRPVVPAVYTVVVVALAIRMLGLSLTALLWLGGAAMLVYDQGPKVFLGPKGFGRHFEPRQLVRGVAPVMLAGVVLCLVALFLTWVPGRAVHRTPTAQGPSSLRVSDSAPPSSDFVYRLLEDAQDAGWDRPGAVLLELMLLGLLGMVALRSEVETPAWLRFVPMGGVVMALIWTLAVGSTQAGPLLFLVGLALVGCAAVFRAFSPPAPEEGPREEESSDEDTVEQSDYREPPPDEEQTSEEAG